MQRTKFSQRFNGLALAVDKLPFHANRGGGSGTYVNEGDWRRWATSAQSLIRAVYGDGTPHYVNFVDGVKNCDGCDFKIAAVRGLFLSAKDDFDGGYVFDVDRQIPGEVLGDFIGLAKEALSAKQKDVAAVLASAALEDALKRFATLSGLDVGGKTMQEVVNALKGAGLVAGAQKGLLDSLPKLRNHALHADWQKIGEPEVASLIAYVEQFLLANFSES